MNVVIANVVCWWHAVLRWPVVVAYSGVAVVAKYGGGNRSGNKDGNKRAVKSNACYLCCLPEVAVVCRGLPWFTYTDLRNKV